MAVAVVRKLIIVSHLFCKQYFDMIIYKKIKFFDQDWANHAVVCKYRDMVMNQWSTVFYSKNLLFVISAE